jgi:pimeloyl-ACP methyl ester carboxylesterase
VPGRRIPWPHDRYSGLSFRDHVLAVPLDNDDPGGVTIELFAREVVAPERAGDDLPWLLFLQGGPGGKAPRPTAADGWLGRALRTHRVLLLDQRGTGRSSPVTARTVAGMAPGQLAAHLRLFRADSIVADAEIARARIAGGARWDTLGQSYGGFITLAYLSRAPEGAAHLLRDGRPAGHEGDGRRLVRAHLPARGRPQRRVLPRVPRGRRGRAPARRPPRRQRDLRAAGVHL